MSVIIDHPAPAGTFTPSIQWPAVFAGAVAAAGLSFVLHSFAAAVGLGVSSTAPTWRDASFALLFLSGLYLILAALAAYGLGGYVVGRLSTRWGAADIDHAEFWDGMRGLLVWALATLMTALFALAIAMSMPRLAAPSGAGAGSSTSIAGENIIAFDLDRLFRSDRRAQQVDLTQARSEAARILLTTTSHRGMLPDDRAYLVRLVAGTTGLPAAEADRRVTEVSTQAKANLDRARRSGILLGFMLGTAALLGAIASWYAACAAGRHRDGREVLPAMWDWGRPSIHR